MYAEGIKYAAHVLHLPRRLLLRLLESSAGLPAVRIPIQSMLGGAAGYAIGKYMDSKHPARQAVTGAAMPVLGGLVFAGAPALHTKLLKLLGSKHASITLDTQLPDPFIEVQRQISKATNVALPKTNPGADLNNLFRNPFKELQLPK